MIYTPVYAIVRERWVSDRVALIGDAAHAIVPFQAQGASLAIEDAVVLADALAAASQVPDALEAFQRAREPRVRAVRNVCRFLGMAMGLEGPDDPATLDRHPGNLGDRAAALAALWSGIDGSADPPRPFPDSSGP